MSGENVSQGERHFRAEITAACDYVSKMLAQTMEPNADVKDLQDDLLELNQILWSFRYAEGNIPRVPKWDDFAPCAPVTPLAVVPIAEDQP